MKQKRTIKNIAASIRERLNNRARELGEDFNLILSRYAVERFLHRLSRSRYANEFILKGAQLFALWTEIPHRVTRDLDLLREGDSSLAKLETIFRAICDQPVEEDDGIEFLANTVKGEAIRERAEYGGWRIRIGYRIATARNTLQVDVGFGDVVIPRPQVVEFPSLLDFSAIHLKAYSRETVIAEKFQAIVMLGIANSRMKDFYDISILAQTFHFDGATLLKAIAATFKRRKTVLPGEMPVALTADFAKDQVKQKIWQGFLNKNRLNPVKADFIAVIKILREFLMPPTLALIHGQKFKQIWLPKGPWQEIV